jgi:hypothetical protein
MVNSTESALCATYEAWKSKRRFLVGESRPLTAWAKRRAKAAALEKLKKRLALRPSRRFVIVP